MTRPLARITLCYLLGLVLGHLYPHPFGLLWTSLTIGFSLAGLFFLVKTDGVRVAYLLATFLILGYLSGSAASTENLPRNHIRNFASGNSLNLEGTIIQPPEAGADRTRLLIEAERLHQDKRYIRVTGKVLLSVRGRDTTLHYGDRIRFQTRLLPPENFHNPGAYNSERALAWQGIYLRGTLPDFDETVFLGKGKVPWLKGKLEEVRHRVRELIDLNSSQESRGILKALVLGQKGDISPEVRRSFARGGVAHLLAISGLHLGFVGGLAFLLFRFLFKLSPWVIQRAGVVLPASLLALVPVTAYSLVAGAAGYSLLRAFIMAVAYFIFLALARKKDLLDALIFAAFLILVLFPHAPFSISFQLSFAAVLAIFWLVPVLLSLINRGEEGIKSGRLWRYFLGTLVVTAAATLGTAPLAAYHFNLVSVVGFIANLLAVPWVGLVIVPLSLLGAASIFFSSPAASYLIQSASIMVSALVSAVTFLAGLPWAYLLVVTPNPLELTFSYLALFFLVMMYKNKARARAGLLSLAAIIFINFGLQALAPKLNAGLEVNFIDVKQGDAALLRFPGGKTMLIDAGGFRDPSFDVGERVVAPYLLKKRITHLNYAVATHPDVDHIGGLVYLVNNFQVDEVWADLSSWEPELKARLSSLLAKRRIKFVPVHEESLAREIGGARVEVLNPPVALQGPGRSKGLGADNNRSVVLKVNYEKVGFLFAADIEKEAEARLALSQKDLSAAVLKVPHHGSKSSSTVEFLERLRPKIAVISASSTNRLGHPAASVVARYLERGVKLYRTDRDGAVTIFTDGRKLEAGAFLNKRSDKFEP